MTLPFALVPRVQPSGPMMWASPLLAIMLTLAAGAVLFASMGQDPLQGLRVFLWDPLSTRRGWSELGLKATPLILCAVGLAVCFRANVWNIGAEGQLIAGAIAGGGIALLATRDSTRALVPAILVAAALGGAAWAAITAWLRDRFNANEILVSLMLVYVAQLLLAWLVHGVWKDPGGIRLSAVQALRSRGAHAARAARYATQRRFRAGAAVCCGAVADARPHW